MPIHRLDEQPTVCTMLADLTCGKCCYPKCLKWRHEDALVLKLSHFNHVRWQIYDIVALCLSLMLTGMQASSQGCSERKLCAQTLTA